MKTSIPGLERDPFGMTGGRPLFVETAPVQDVLELLDEVYRDPKGLGILTGPAGSGRRSILEHFARRLEERDVAAVVLDGRGMKRVGLLGWVLGEIGYELESLAPEDLSSMLRVFLIHQCHAGQPAFIGIVNAAEMHPSALEEVCRLAEITAGEDQAVRLVLAGDERLAGVISAPAMAPVRERITARSELRALDLIETDDYIVRHLRAAGAASHREFLTDSAIALIWRASGGLPGEIRRLTHEALTTLELPVNSERIREFLHLDPIEETASTPVKAGPDETEEEAAPTRLIVSRSGETLLDALWQNGRVLIGRDPLNDIVLENRYVSRHHTLLILETDRAWLVDLKSMNGTLVNSRRVTEETLRHEDIISIGDFRLKYLNPAARGAQPTRAQTASAETAIMRSIEAVRHLAPVETAEDTIVRGLLGRGSSGKTDG